MALRLPPPPPLPPEHTPAAQVPDDDAQVKKLERRVVVQAVDIMPLQQYLSVEPGPPNVIPAKQLEPA